MLSVDLSSLYSDEIDELINGVNEATNNIKNYIENRKINKREEFKGVINDIKDVGLFWTGKTYVGDKKRTIVSNAFQRFFESLMNLLLVFKGSGNQYEKSFAKKLLYRGKIYRYLGEGCPTNAKHKPIEPIYDGIYVSWSKNPTNSYIESKLYGIMTWVEAEIIEPYYGIDLETLGCSRANENEVVFPTIKKCIIEVKYIQE